MWQKNASQCAATPEKNLRIMQLRIEEGPDQREILE